MSRDQSMENEVPGTSRRDVLKLSGLAALGGVAAGSLVGSSTASAASPATKTQGDFNLSNRFSLEIDGVLVAGVHSVSAPTSTTDFSVTPPVTTGTATLTRDFSSTSEWFVWRNSVIAGKTDRKSISVIFFNEKNKVSGRLNLFNCLPVGWSAPDLNAKSSGHATEKLEISWETMELKAS